MNDRTKELLKKLEQATTRVPSDEPSDDEATTLRESWVTLGRLLEAADAELEEVVPQPRRMARSSRWFAVVLTIAAALLVAVVSWRLVKRASESDAPAPVIAADHDDGPDSVASEFAWDDSFEDELARASVAIYSARSDWNTSEASYSSLSDRFAEFEEELQQGSL